LSSILEALKKAERESTEGRDADFPLPASLPRRSPYPVVRRRWWLPLGAAGLLCIGIVLFWQLRRPDSPRPTATPAPPAVSEKQKSSPPPLRRLEIPKPSPGPEKNASAVAQGPAAETAPAPRAKTPAATTAPVQPEQRPVRKSLPPMVAMAPPSRPPETRPQPPAPAPKSAPAPADPSPVVPREAVQHSQPPTPPLEESDKSYRSDPRIELQALVWSPDAAERFVIVNDRLIKEGGSIEGIHVVRINPDDVLVSEGSKRWHEPFKIR
jgi:hypothetical protein